jgi:hypothetical protein
MTGGVFSVGLADELIESVRAAVEIETSVVARSLLRNTAERRCSADVSVSAVRTSKRQRLFVARGRVAHRFPKLSEEPCQLT